MNETSPPLSSPPLDESYQQARQAWDDRLGTALSHARNWRLMAFAEALLLALVLAAYIHKASQASVMPYLIEVADAGQVVRPLGPPPAGYTPQSAWIQVQITEWIRRVRALPTDPVVLREQWVQAYRCVTEKGRALLTTYAQNHDPFAQLKKLMITVHVLSVVPLSATSYQVQWEESLFNAAGQTLGTPRFTGIVAIVLRPPRTEEEVRANPLGVYVDAFSWAEQLTIQDRPLGPASSPK